jgi:hypothetical protein
MVMRLFASGILLALQPMRRFSIARAISVSTFYYDLVLNVIFIVKISNYELLY